MEGDEALQASALISSQTDSIEKKVHDLSAEHVITSRIYVGRIFLPANQVFYMEEFLVSSTSDLIDARWLQVNLNCTGYEFASLLNCESVT